MRTEKILSRWLQPLTCFMHATRQKALLDVVGAVLKGRRLWVTSPWKERCLGPPLSSIASNEWIGCWAITGCGLSAMRVYRRLAAQVIGRAHRVVVLVDWTYVNDTQAALVASVPIGGRAQIVYAHVHDKKRVGNRAAHRAFLRDLKDVLPEGRHVVLVTDAGFGRTWMQEAQSFGFDFVTRLTRNNSLQPHTDSPSIRVCELFARAKTKPTTLGMCAVTKKHPIEAKIVMQRMKKLGRHRSPHRRRGLHSTSVLHQCYKRRRHEPWVLACSDASLSARCIARIYQSRMCCEQAFRDGKNTRFGLGLGHVNVRRTERLVVLWLLVALALWVVSLLGSLGQKAGVAKRLQANTVKDRRVFSCSVLGLLILEHRIPIPLSLRRLAQAKTRLSKPPSTPVEPVSFVGIHQTTVGCVGLEVSIKHVGSQRLTVRRVGGVHKTLLLKRIEAVFLHQSCDAMNADWFVVLNQVMEHSRRAIRRLRFVLDHTHLYHDALFRA